MKEKEMEGWHQSQRGYFAGALFSEMLKDSSIYLLTGDLGYGMFDKIQNMFPGRFINCGAAEQAMLDIAVGLAQEGKKPFVYTITSFFLRAAETISLYLAHENIAVRLVGSGVGDNYRHDGYSHDGTKAQEFIHSCQLMEHYPTSKEQIPTMVKYMVEHDEASFIGLIR